MVGSAIVRCLRQNGFSQLVLCPRAELDLCNQEAVNSFFSETSPEDYDYYHVTSFTGRPEQKLKRIYGKIDNFMRNSFVKITGFTRGKDSSRIKR